jgi:hypothetical protein
MWTQTKLVWSAHRHSSSVKTFKSVMLLRHEGWNWADTPAAASIWLLDGGLPCTSVELEKLAAIQANNGSKVALLSRQFMTLPGLECMFFKAHRSRRRRLFGPVSICRQGTSLGRLAEFVPVYRQKNPGEFAFFEHCLHRNAARMVFVRVHRRSNWLDGILKQNVGRCVG